MDYVAVSRHVNDLLNVTGQAWSRLSGTAGPFCPHHRRPYVRCRGLHFSTSPGRPGMVRRPSRGVMKQADWAEEIARKLLEIPLPRR